TVAAGTPSNGLTVQVFMFADPTTKKGWYEFNLAPEYVGDGTWTGAQPGGIKQAALLSDGAGNRVVAHLTKGATAEDEHWFAATGAKAEAQSSDPHVELTQFTHKVDAKNHAEVVQEATTFKVPLKNVVSDGAIETVTVKYHYLGTNNVGPYTLSANDWRMSADRVWSLYTDGPPAELDDNPAPANIGRRAALGVLDGATDVIELGIAAAGVYAFAYSDAADGGKLKLEIYNTDPVHGEHELSFWARIDRMDTVPVTGFTEVGDGH
ncbi:MAG: hypothetical protein PHU85_03055, partial [Phycisphaerae bacterium]|nr:hypothetical protein [Phycisphaerae bacterium]